MLTREQILEKRTKERTVLIPDLGEVRVRALTREEAVSVMSKGEREVAEVEIDLIALALIEPRLSREDVKEWYSSSPAGELTPVSEAITELSGLATDAAKSGV